MMSKGEFLTRFTIWVTLAGYLAGVALLALSRNKERRERAARLVWTIACVSLLAHVACAFHFYHGWSHEAAYTETARQTEDVVGLNWGGGLYINYALVAAWVADVVWWWRGPGLYCRRSIWLVAAWHGFLLFILFNATVVFKTGPLRVAGVFLFLASCLLWWYAAASRSTPKPNKRAGIVVKD